MSRANDAIRFAKASRGPQWIPASERAPAHIIVAFGDDPEQLAAVGEDGVVQWRAAFGGVVSPISWDDARVYAGCSDGRAVAIDRKTGEVLWSRDHGTAMAVPCIHGASLLLGDAEGDLTELDAFTGSVLRRTTIGRSLVAPVVGRGRLWLSLAEGEIVCKSLDTYFTVWRRRLEAPLASAVLGARCLVVAPLANRVVQVMAEETGDWLFRLEDCGAVRPVIAADQIWLYQRDAVRPYSAGGNEWSPTPLRGVRSLMVHARVLGARLFFENDEGVWAVDRGAPDNPVRMPVTGPLTSRLRLAENRLLAVHLHEEAFWLTLMDAKTRESSWSVRLNR